MTDALYDYWRASLPEELASSLSEEIAYLEAGDYEALLKCDLAQTLLGHQNNEETQTSSFSSSILWTGFILNRLELLSERKDITDQNGSGATQRQNLIFLIALAALNSFLQCSITGPPLPFSSAKVILPREVSSSAADVSAVRSNIVRSFTVDGVGAYRLTPNIELLALADSVLSFALIKNNVQAAVWAKLRVDFLHQRLLSEIGPSLQTAIYDSLETVDKLLTGPDDNNNARVSFLLERAVIQTYHGFDQKARADLEQAATLRGFEFALTGLLGKRTKFQERDISQLVVLACSKDSTVKPTGELGETIRKATQTETGNPNKTEEKDESQPVNLDLNDDTLLESISFAEKTASSVEVKDQSSLSESLKALDPGNQPILHPLDSIVLLSLASSITNTSPSNGLTREETIPYATRVLDGGSSNWQIYTQALLVRSRIEGYRPRTMERGLLQLQALVDQVIAETTSQDTETSGGSATTFLPRAKESESAPVTERLKYLFQLNSPSRWELESELAAKWVSMGGLRTALEIYERLEMWADAALCWAATDREEKAIKIVRRQLFHATSGNDTDADLDTETWEGEERQPPPTDAPRLYCILGDINKDTAMYEKAWEVSNKRYARAQRSIGRHYWALGEHAKAADAYEKSLKVNQLNQPSWFALGCASLELSQFNRAKEAFSRSVQLDDTDAESWSNLAAALLHLTSETQDEAPEQTEKEIDEEDSLETPTQNPHQYKRDALKALKRASHLKFESYRIWDNVLTVAASVIPPSYQDVVTAMTRIAEIRGPSVGEKCIDETILELLVRHIIIADTENLGYDPEKPGLSRMVVNLVDKTIVPLITSSSKLWAIVARLALWRKRPGSALDAHEKAWRAVISQPGWETNEEKQWNGVVDATVDLVDAYESLGNMEKTEGLAAGSGELVAKDWKFKSRSALRGIMGRGKANWEDTEGWERLKEKLESLKG